MLKSITGAVAAGIFGSLILSTSVSAQSGTRITLSDSPQASQTTQSIVDTPPIIQAPSQPAIDSMPQLEMRVPTAECNRCEAATVQSFDTC